MPTLAVDSGHLLFVACGKRMHNMPGWEGTGNEVLMFTYDIDSNIWTNILYLNRIYTANYSGGAAISGDVAVFANYKWDQDGTLWNESYSNPGFGVWTVNGTSLEYKQFASKSELSGKDKVGCHSSGVVAVAYESAGGTLYVYVSTDYGATWNLRKTVGATASRKDYSLTIGDDGKIYLAHQSSSSYVRVEVSSDNGVTWPTNYNNSMGISGITNVKISEDGGRVFLFVHNGTTGAIEFSKNYGASWYTVSYEPGPSIMAGGIYVDDPDDDIALSEITGGVIHYYKYWLGDNPDYGWAESEFSERAIDGTTLTATVGGDPAIASFADGGGRFAYSSYLFYTSIDQHVAVLISDDMGEHWYVRATPLSQRFENEETLFDGCPLFCLTDVPHLNHVWKFEKSDWNARFVKQKDKYVTQVPCVCPQYRGT